MWNGTWLSISRHDSQKADGLKPPVDDGKSSIRALFSFSYVFSSCCVLFQMLKASKMDKFVKSFTHSVDVLKGGFGFQTEGDMTDASSDFRAEQKRLGAHI
jgi:hypothetical protein